MIHMAGLLPSDTSFHGTHEGGYEVSPDNAEGSGRWYFSRKEIEEDSPSKRDGIDLKKETYLRKSYCTFLQDLGMRLKVPQVTIATAIIFCHRFFLRHSHAKNDRRTIATVCMFLAGKVEETPRPLKDVIMVSYEIINKKDPAAVHRIKQKEVYEQQKELILLGERVVLATLGFDFNVHHPYKPLVEAIKKFKVAQNALAQVAWNFVNDGLRTSLCLQFKPHHVAAGAIFLAAKFLKVKLPSDGEKVWWQEFDVTPRQLEEVSNQMLELYEQNRLPPSQGSELEGSTTGGAPHRAPPKAPPANEDNATTDGFHQAGGTTTVSERTNHGMPDDPHADNHGGPPTAALHNADGKSKEDETSVPNPMLYQDNLGEAPTLSRAGTEGLGEGQESISRRKETREAWEMKDRHSGRNLENRDSTIGQSPQEAIKMINKDKLKAVMKQRKLRGDISRKKDLMDEDDLIEKELEDGIELVAEREKQEWDSKQGWSKPLSRTEQENSRYGKLHEDGGDGHHQGTKKESLRALDLEKTEEGEVSALNDASHHGSRSPKMDRKRKPGSVLHNHHDSMDDRNRLTRVGYSERDHKRHVHENHV